MDTVYIGIDPTAGRRPIHYAVLDEALQLVARGLGKLDQVLAAVLAYPAAVVAVDAPQGPNQGLMRLPERRTHYGLPPHTQTWADFRVCEYELRRRGIRLYRTPAEAEAAPKWMRLGFELYAALRAAGYEAYQPAADGLRRVLEVHPHASYTVLLGHVPMRKDSLEGRLQRQALLFHENLDVPDPLDAVEEITRHHLLEGTLTLPGVYTHDELDALVSAFTAHLAARQPHAVTLVGDPAEGQIVVPVPPGDYKDVYR